MSVNNGSNNSFQPDFLFPIVFLFLWLFLLVGCYEPVEACLDLQATNFEVTADRACSDCCTYPTLSLSFSHKVDSNFLSNEDVYLNRVGRPYRIESVVFYISNVQLVDAAGNGYGVEDQIELLALNNGVEEWLELEDNFLLIERTTRNVTLGEFRSSGDFVGLRFFVGINAPANNANPASLPDGHPLSIGPDSLHWDQQ
ncbi:MAG: MbnP family protein, partial [Bacteroidota bacterium]